MATKNPVKQGFDTLEETSEVEYKWMSKNTVKISKDGSICGATVKFEKFEDSNEVSVLVKEFKYKMWDAVAILREEDQKPEDFKMWLEIISDRVVNGKYA